MPASIRYRSPIGPLEIAATDRGITQIAFVDDGADAGGGTTVAPLLKRCVDALAAYFDGRLTDFDLPLDPRGTPFQSAVWRRLTEIPFGATATYAQVARAVGRPKAFRAVGGANNRNPVAIVIPCHRVIGSDGRLVGYGSGLWRKQWLLEHEGRYRR